MKLTRRTTMAALGGGAMGLGAVGAYAATTKTSPFRLWYRQPAKQWVEALPIGSGRMGAMVFGGVATERLQLNEDTLWAGGPYDPANPEALKALPEIRALIDAGEYAKATEMAEARFMATPKRQMSYQTLGDLKLDLPGPGGRADRLCPRPRSGRRDRHHRLHVGGVRHTRQVIGSYPDRVIAVRLTADKAKAISVDLDFDNPLKSKPVSSVEGRHLVLTGVSDEPAGHRRRAEVRVPRAGDQQGRDRVSAKGGALSVAGADEVLLLIAPPPPIAASTTSAAIRRRDQPRHPGQGRRQAWPALLAAHQADHRACSAGWTSTSEPPRRR
jgi:alpha-L-fucosidase 2